MSEQHFVPLLELRLEVLRDLVPRECLNEYEVLGGDEKLYLGEDYLQLEVLVQLVDVERGRNHLREELLVTLAGLLVDFGEGEGELLLLVVEEQALDQFELQIQVFER